MPIETLKLFSPLFWEMSRACAGVGIRGCWFPGRGVPREPDDMDCCMSPTLLGGVDAEPKGKDPFDAGIRGTP